MIGIGIGVGVNSYVAAGGITFDTDAQSFITAASISDFTQQNAINTLVLSLKNYSLWTKMKAVYPFVGGTSTTHKFNLKDPRDLDAAYRLVFNGGWTHSSTGALPNGTNAFSRTFLIPSSVLTQNSQHMSYYSGTSGSTTGVEMGCWNNNTFFHMISFNRLGIGYALLSANNTGTYTFTPTGSDGYLVASRTASNLTKAFRNNSNVMTSTTASSGMSPFEIYIGARNDSGTANMFSNKQCRFVTIGDGLTDGEMANLYTAIQDYQTSLTRQV